MEPTGRILSLEELPAWREAQRQAGRRVVATNGCFDLLHQGHVACLQGARALGDCLVVGLNDDESVRALKGPDRPWVPAEERAFLLAALRVVDAVCVFPQLDAVEFLRRARPDVYVKGGDYTLETLHPGERRLLEAMGSRIVLIPPVPGRSSSALIRRIQAARLQEPAAEAVPVQT
ncbi:MAG: ADP-heptose synthase [Verrucomicrobia bacterium]|nr:MAG: ADP-heptose synthase [Verrucomicrobiota bacterium]